MDSVFKLNKASNFKEFREAASGFAVPSQNLIYADTKGNIGYQAPGRIPVRGASTTGATPHPAGTGATGGRGTSRSAPCPGSTTRRAATS